MTSNKRVKLDKPSKKWIINWSNNGNASQWRNSKDSSLSLTSDLQSWIDYAKLAEKGKLNALFIADQYSVPESYQGPNNWKVAFKNGVMVPRIDPSILASAVANETESIGLGITFSTLSEHPYLLSRRLSTLDHFTRGRIGWNIVSSYLESSGRQLLNGNPLPEHDERYVKTEEYFQVVNKLLQSSWREDAIVNDGETLIDPERVREINHEGKYFKVRGPSVTEPSPQRIPLLIQAGSSIKGKILAAEMAEMVFLGITNSTKLINDVKFIRKAAKEAFGRDPSSIKFVVPVHPIVAETEEEAQLKLKELYDSVSLESAAVSFSGISGLDLSNYEDDEELKPKVEVNASKGMTESRIKAPNGQLKTKITVLKDSIERARFVGTPKQVADQLQELIEKHDIDGFNFGFSAIFPSTLEDIVNLLIPELQSRGLFWDEYPVKGGTLRENFYGKEGLHQLPDGHPYNSFIWKAGISKEKFEKQVKEAEDFLTNARIKAAEIITLS